MKITVWTYEDAFTMALDDPRDEYDRTRGGDGDYATCEHCGEQYDIADGCDCDDDSGEYGIVGCDACGDTDNGPVYIGNTMYCRDCVADCECCGDTVPASETTEVEGLTACFDCAPDVEQLYR